ncbi:MAG: hypothetical protein K2O67_01370 [Clostridia bacterium]|nr:hypothetical protein [Clostridia bacterium]
MKLLGGISSQQPPVTDGSYSAAEEPNAERKQFAPQSAPVQQAGHRNVMADVIERHERIIYRNKRK